MNLLLTGHPRSGTWLLQRLCDRHPDVRVTYEFGIYRTLNVPIALYVLNILGRCWATRFRPVLSAEPERGPYENLWRSTVFKARFLAGMVRRSPVLVQPGDVEAVLKDLFPDASVVGDKYPNAVLNLGAYAGRDDLRTVVIYRDPRDVVASYLDLLDEGYDRSPVFGEFTSARSIAENWVQAAKYMQAHREDVLCLRYEALVRDPEPELQRLGEWIDVDPSGFPASMIEGGSVGSFHDRLSARDIQRVEEVAGPYMDAQGYARVAAS